MEDCIFCKITAHKMDADIVWENDEIAAFKDINPSAKTHILFVPKKHVEGVREMNEAEDDHLLVGRMVLAARNWAKAQAIDGYQLKFHCGKGGGQEIFHIHLHLLSNQG